MGDDLWLQLQATGNCFVAVIQGMLPLMGDSGLAYSRHTALRSALKIVLNPTRAIQRANCF